MELPARVGARQDEGDPLAHIVNADMSSRYAELESQTETSKRHVRLASLSSPGEALAELAKSDQVQSQHNQVSMDLESLRLPAPAEGRVLQVLVDRPGSFVQRGDPILIYGSGEVEAVFYLRSVEFESLRLVTGDEVVCRSPAYPGLDIRGVVTRIGQVATRDIEPRILQAAPQGLVPINSATGAVIDSFFEINLCFPEIDADLIGSQLKAKVPAKSVTVAQMLERRIKRFLNRVKQSPSS